MAGQVRVVGILMIVQGVLALASGVYFLVAPSESIFQFNISGRQQVEV
jgi:hypothetical protein